VTTKEKFCETSPNLQNKYLEKDQYWRAVMYRHWWKKTQKCHLYTIGIVCSLADICFMNCQVDM